MHTLLTLGAPPFKAALHNRVINSPQQERAMERGR